MGVKVAIVKRVGSKQGRKLTIYVNMKAVPWILTLVLALCISYVLCQSSKKKDTGTSLSDKVQQLIDSTAKRPVIRLNGNKFRDYVRNAPRNYSIMVMFTALSATRQCAICKQAHEEYQVVANSYRYSQHYSNKLFFAMVDFDEGPDVFQTMKLNSAPVFMHFPARANQRKWILWMCRELVLEQKQSQNGLGKELKSPFEYYAHRIILEPSLCSSSLASLLFLFI